jgi:hypothetical protein
MVGIRSSDFRNIKYNKNNDANFKGYILFGFLIFCIALLCLSLYCKFYKNRSNKISENSNIAFEPISNKEICNTENTIV